jgi:splicing factor 3A subunit 3
LCSKFYDRLKDVRDYHKKYPVTDIMEAEDDSGMIKEEPHVDFSGEEGVGR